MLQCEREKLYNRDSEYLSIGISEDGTSHGRYPVPWDSTADAYNMKLPKVYISKDDLNDRNLWQRFVSLRCMVVISFVPLKTMTF